MALQVYQSKNKYVGGGKWHLIKKRFWGGTTVNALTSLQIQLFCEDEAHDRTPTKFNGCMIESFDKTIHMKDLCELCLKKVQEYTNTGGQQAKPSHHT